MPPTKMNFEEAVGRLRLAADQAADRPQLQDALAGVVEFLTEGWMRVGEAAETLGVVENTVKNWVRLGRFPSAYQTDGGHWRLQTREVLALRDASERAREANRTGKLELVQYTGEDVFEGQPDC